MCILNVPQTMDKMKHLHLTNHNYHRFVTVSVTMLIPSLTHMCVPYLHNHGDQFST